MGHHGPLCWSPEPPGVCQVDQVIPTPGQEEIHSVGDHKMARRSSVAPGGKELLINDKSGKGTGKTGKDGLFQLRPKADTGCPPP